jgi:D-3-phosphoglycerate dehydrogenase
MYLLVFDFDSTIVSVEGLDELFARSLDGDPDRAAKIAGFREVTDLGMAGAISAGESLRRRLSILDVGRPLVEAVAADIRERLTPSVARNERFFRENAGRIHIVSGGFEELILPTLDRLGLSPSRLHAHRFQFDPAGRVIGLDPQTPMATGGKPGVVESLASAGSPIWVVGDGATDLEVRERGFAERFVAFTENRHRGPVAARADHVAGSMDDLFRMLEHA